MDERVIRTIGTAFCLGVVVGVAFGIMLAPPPTVRVVRFVSLPPAADQCDPGAVRAEVQ